MDFNNQFKERLPKQLVDKHSKVIQRYIKDVRNEILSRIDKSEHKSISDREAFTIINEKKTQMGGKHKRSNVKNK